MIALQPIFFEVKDADSLNWSKKSENLSLFYHIINSCANFPSLILAYSSATCMHEVATEIAASLLFKGINIFVPDQPTPIAALSQAIGSRAMPLGIYLDWSPSKQLCKLSAINKHGGPIDYKDVLDSNPVHTERTGVLGQAQLDKHYTDRLAELVDPFIEPGKGFSEFITPFNQINEKVKNHKKLKHLFNIDPEGPIGEISNDGQTLTITEQSGKILNIDQIVSTIVIYLNKERMACGSILGPIDLPALTHIGNYVEANDSSFNMSYRAGFENLLIGWSNDGVIAHQGSSCFGDAFLTALYIIEAWRS